MCALYKAYMHYIYIRKSCVKQCLDALVFMLMTRLVFTKCAHKQVQEQLYYSYAFVACNFLQKSDMSMVYMSVKLK